MTNEWFENVKTSILVPDNLDKHVWGFSIMDDETIFSTSIKEFLNMLETSAEFYNNPTTECMLNLAEKYLQQKIETARLGGEEYIKKILPLFLKDVIIDD